MAKLTLQASKTTKHTPAGELPVDWACVNLSSVATIKSGGTPDRAIQHFWGGSIPWVKTGEISFNHIWRALETITEEGLRASSAWIVPRGSLLMAMYGQGKTRGQVAILGVDAAINQACAAIQPSSPAVDNVYLFYHLQNRYAEIRDLSNTGNQENLNAQVIRQIPIALPPLPEQRKIADILSAWDDALEKLDALIATKERRLRGLMQQLLTGKRRLSAFRGHSWKPLHMSDVLERVFRPAEIDGSRPLALVSIRRRFGGLFRRPDILASEYKTQDLHELKAGDFLISKRQVVHGAWALVNAEFEDALVSKEYVILVNRAPGVLDMRFFAWLSKTPRMLRLARVSSTGVHIEKLIFDPDVFLWESIRIPSDVAEQSAIADILDACDEELHLMRAQCTALDLQKRGLMQRLLTGKVRVRP